MSRAHNGSRAVTRLSRRRVLTIAATVGVGASAVGVAGLSLAGESGKKAAAEGAPLVISLRDAKAGTFDVFSGGSRIELVDKDLAERLLDIAARG
jgi:nitrous oxide reductase